ncbi:hypothetical protein [Halococcus sp. AFM35]|uniref:hypothetical protein n=1 Tax=Halococcus sp. AFM35 TaxID=3421653 RepID=UPI003EBDA76E
MIQSWYEASAKTTTHETIQFTNEWGWNERRLETAIANGGGEEGAAMTDSGETVDGSAESE